MHPFPTSADNLALRADRLSRRDARRSLRQFECEVTFFHEQASWLPCHPAMRTTQTKEAQALVRIDEFTEQRKGDFTHDPLKPVDRKHAAATEVLKKAIKDLGGKAAIQASGAFSQQTEEKRIMRQDLEDEMRNYIRTTDAIAEETKNPALMDRFRMPAGNGDGELKTKARTFAVAIRELALNDEFAAHGHSGEDADGNALAPDAVLDALADEFQSGEGSQGNARSTRAGATQAIQVHLREGRGAVKTFDAIYHNTYRDNAEMLAAWETVSRVERTGGATTRSGEPVVSPIAGAADAASPVATPVKAVAWNGTLHDAQSPSAAATNGTGGNGTAHNAPLSDAAPSNGAGGNGSATNGTTANRTASASV